MLYLANYFLGFKLETIQIEINEANNKSCSIYLKHGCKSSRKKSTYLNINKHLIDIFIQFLSCQI